MCRLATPGSSSYDGGLEAAQGEHRPLRDDLGKTIEMTGGSRGRCSSSGRARPFMAGPSGTPPTRSPAVAAAISRVLSLFTTTTWRRVGGGVEPRVLFPVWSRPRACYESLGAEPTTARVRWTDLVCRRRDQMTKARSNTANTP